MEKKDLVRFCRYYKGDKKGKIKDEDLFFYDAEKYWVDFSLNSKDILATIVGEYTSTDLATFEQMDDTPVSLKAMLFNRYMKWNSGSIADNIEPFKKWYLKEYKKGLK